ncbi:MAG TPA: YciI family protein [Fibrobacteria bacterium]|nr:YciI family protein [Fibrobacteria bacterium]
MNHYALIFRMDILTASAQPSPEEMRRYMESWMRWTDSIDAEGRLEGGNHFSPSGWVLRQGGARSDLPYAAQNESVAGYLLIRAPNDSEALRIAQACPILEGQGTSVEVRELASPR